MVQKRLDLNSSGVIMQIESHISKFPQYYRLTFLEFVYFTNILGKIQTPEYGKSLP